LGLKVNRWKRWGLLAVVVVVLGIPASWFFVQRSEAFSVARTLVVESPLVTSNIGTVKRISLQPFGYHLRFSGAQGNAHFQFSLSGEQKKAIAYVELEKQGSWEVRVARLVVPDQPAVALK
jgi:hypothetical protein